MNKTYNGYKISIVSNAYLGYGYVITDGVINMKSLITSYANSYDAMSDAIAQIDGIYGL